MLGFLLDRFGCRAVPQCIEKLMILGKIQMLQWLLSYFDWKWSDELIGESSSEPVNMEVDTVCCICHSVPSETWTPPVCSHVICVSCVRLMFFQSGQLRQPDEGSSAFPVQVRCPLCRRWFEEPPMHGTDLKISLRY